MFKLFFILSFFLGFAQISPAEACDADHVWPNEVAWATHVISEREYCEGDNTYYCAHMIRSCQGKAQEILAEVERKKQEESESKKKLQNAEATEKYHAEVEKEWEVREEAEALKELREEHPEYAERFTEALKELREEHPEYADKEYFKE